MANRKLADLDACFLGTHGSDPRTGIGVQFECPCGCDSPIYVAFDRPLDGGPPLPGERCWTRTGDTIETLTLRPSILRIGGCGWHGWVTDGEAVTC